MDISTYTRNVIVNGQVLTQKRFPYYKLFVREIRNNVVYRVIKSRS